MQTYSVKRKGNATNVTEVYYHYLHWKHTKSPKWQLLVQPVTNISSKWHLRFNVWSSVVVFRLTITRRWLATLRDNAMRRRPTGSSITSHRSSISHAEGCHNESFVVDSPSGSFEPPAYSRTNSIQSSFDIGTYVMAEPPPYQEIDPNASRQDYTSIPLTSISSLPGSGALFPLPGPPSTPVTSPAMTSSPAAPSGFPPPYCELAISDLSPIAESPLGVSPTHVTLVPNEAPPPYDAPENTTLWWYRLFERTNLTLPTMHLFRITKSTIQNKKICCALWDMKQVHFGLVH